MPGTSCCRPARSAAPTASSATGLDGQRACRACYEKFRILPCSRCGRDKPVAAKTVDGRPLCHPCTRRIAEKQPVTFHQATVVRREIKAATQLVTWLRARGTSLSTCTQHDIDDWLAGDVWLRYIARSFLAWSVRNRHAHGVTIPHPPKDASMTLIEDDQRWAHVRRLVKGDRVDNVTRVAGLLLLLFAQPLSRTSRIRLDQVTQEDTHVMLTFGSHPVLPPPWTPWSWSSSSTGTTTRPSDAVSITLGSSRGRPADSRSAAVNSCASSPRWASGLDPAVTPP